MGLHATMICASGTVSDPSAFRDCPAADFTGAAMPGLSWPGGPSQARKIAGIVEVSALAPMAHGLVMGSGITAPDSGRRLTLSDTRPALSA
ncbi:MAG: hypothetical protein KUA43_05515 [Hoeflea sp.]|uniref:hypothetical protein n=1 Tax=Hoeflea sp. TaxID=1940281 RepID=UPI001DE91F09|nr:hypothetical protein [Hoeflea sp.]MBU4530990.1 hypothetical protein [Alphaproteobacteria bacterium]MBU4542765.1 hypothetical protein [Alphaproteobacteria bacterium]MBU4552577.1 hypothetical protein [Alphaproteobacteria bacterium]MBV1722882.1 hypothetical protein [Hoeflea sp.]MBV1762793.1 hypothetical protein [Hoeflea sp.]